MMLSRLFFQMRMEWLLATKMLNLVGKLRGGLMKAPFSQLI